jgi:hypothetical protein
MWRPPWMSLGTRFFLGPPEACKISSIFIQFKASHPNDSTSTTLTLSEWSEAWVILGFTCIDTYCICKFATSHFPINWSFFHLLSNNFWALFHLPLGLYGFNCWFHMLCRIWAQLLDCSSPLSSPVVNYCTNHKLFTNAAFWSHLCHWVCLIGLEDT